MPRRIAYYQSTAQLAAIATSFAAHAAPPLEHKYEFSGFAHEESVVSSHRLSDQINATIESKSKYGARSIYGMEDVSSEQKAEIGYRYDATPAIALSPVASMEGNEQRMKQSLLFNAHHKLSSVLSLRIGYGYEDQRYFGGNLPIDQYRSVGKAGFEYRLEKLKASYGFTHKNAHASPHASKSHIIEHEINLEYAVCSMLNPYLKLESLEPFSLHSERETLFWIGIRRAWR